MNSTFFFHTPNPAGGSGVHRATIAAKIEDDQIVYGVSICSEYDNFSRETGREIAATRMADGFGKTKYNNGHFDAIGNIGGQYAALAEFTSTLANAMERNWEKYKRRISKYKGDTVEQAD